MVRIYKINNMLKVSKIDLNSASTESTESHIVNLVRKTYKRPKGKKLTAIMSENFWSYVQNEKGEAMPYTLAGQGSCTPTEIGQAWIDALPPKEWMNLYKSVKKNKDKIV